MNITNKDIPFNYARCISTVCPKRESCLRSLAWMALGEGIRVTTVLNPALATEDEHCPYYRSNEPQQYAIGFTNFQRRMFPGQYEKFMWICIRHFGRNKYFKRRRGETPIPPAEQAFIRDALRKAGVSDDLDFDAYETRLDWTDW